MEGKDRKKGDFLRSVVVLALSISMLLMTIRINKIQQENELIVSYLIENAKLQITNHQMNEKILECLKIVLADSFGIVPEEDHKFHKVFLMIDL